MILGSEQASRTVYADPPSERGPITSTTFESPAVRDQVAAHVGETAIDATAVAEPLTLAQIGRVAQDHYTNHRKRATDLEDATVWAANLTKTAESIRSNPRQQKAISLERAEAEQEVAEAAQQQAEHYYNLSLSNSKKFADDHFSELKELAVMDAHAHGKTPVLSEPLVIGRAQDRNDK